MEMFYLEEHITGMEQISGSKKEVLSFNGLCRSVSRYFQTEWESSAENARETLEIQKKAIIGYDCEVMFFKNKIREYVKMIGASKTKYPDWYETLEDAVYHENWGLAGIAQWFSHAYKESSSAKVIGNRIYFLDQGRMIIQKQRISQDRREQLIRAFLLLKPDERLDKDFHELYMIDGTRVTIFRGNMVKKDQDVIIFRRYIIPDYTFEEQASRGTIPWEAVPLFKAMVPLGFNIAVTGAVRTSKTTFLSTWQRYESKDLEGVMVETDPEVPLHKLMPEAPIVQILADNDQLKGVTKNLMRSDADYIIMAEAREGTALDTVLKIASKGTKRVKITFHAREPMDFPYDVASEIVKSMGGDIHYTACRVAASFDYIFHLVQLPDKNRKRLKSIYEMSLDRTTQEIKMKKICMYCHDSDSWRWFDTISNEKCEIAKEEDPEAYIEFMSIHRDILKNFRDELGETEADN